MLIKLISNNINDPPENVIQNHVNKKKKFRVFLYPKVLKKMRG